MPAASLTRIFAPWLAADLLSPKRMCLWTRTLASSSWVTMVSSEPLLGEVLPTAPAAAAAATTPLPPHPLARAATRQMRGIARSILFPGIRRRVAAASSVPPLWLRSPAAW